MTDFPNRLRALRKAAGLRQQEVAAHLHIHRTAYVKYETGRATPSLESIRLLCRLFHVSADELLDV